MVDSSGPGDMARIRDALECLIRDSTSMRGELASMRGEVFSRLTTVEQSLDIDVPLARHPVTPASIDAACKESEYYLALCVAYLRPDANDRYLGLRGVCVVLNMLLDKTWRMLTHMVYGKTYGAHSRVGGRFPAGVVPPDFAMSWSSACHTEVADGALKAAIERWIAHVKPVVQLDASETRYTDIRSYWLMLLHDIWDIREIPRSEDEFVYVPHHGHYELEVDCVSTKELDTTTSTRNGKNALYKMCPSKLGHMLIEATKHTLSEMRSLARHDSKPGPISGTDSL